MSAAPALPEEAAVIERPHPYRIEVQYITDEEGNRLRVILSNDDWELLLDQLGDLWDLRAYEEAIAEGGEPIPWEDAVKHLDEIARATG